MATPISYGIGISDQNLQAMLNSDTPEIRQQAESISSGCSKPTNKKQVFYKNRKFLFSTCSWCRAKF